MRIKKNTNARINAELLGVKVSRVAAAIAAEQAERLLRQDNEERPSCSKPKKGKQAERGRTRVERARPAVITGKQVLALEHLLAEMATQAILEDERGHTRFERNTRWGYPSMFIAGFRGFYTHIWAKYVPTIEGLMAFEDELYYGGVLPRGYVTPDEVIAVTGRRLGK